MNRASTLFSIEGVEVIEYFEDTSDFYEKGSKKGRMLFIVFLAASIFLLLFALSLLLAWQGGVLKYYKGDKLILAVTLVSFSLGMLCISVSLRHAVMPCGKTVRQSAVLKFSGPHADEAKNHLQFSGKWTLTPYKTSLWLAKREYRIYLSAGSKTSEMRDENENGNGERI